MKRIISYCLYGALPQYLVGAVRNAESAARFYPGWTTRFYVGRSVPAQVLADLRAHDAEVLPMPGREDASAMFWRFLAFAEPDTEMVMIRDCDSRFSERESAAVREWLASGSDFHIMRDHPCHNRPILGGLWGARTAPLDRFVQRVRESKFEGRYDEDQGFLAAHVYPLARASSCVHDSFFWSEPWRRPFPSTRLQGAFVGERFDEHDRPNPVDREVLRRTERSFLRLNHVRLRTLMSGDLNP